MGKWKKPEVPEDPFDEVRGAVQEIIQYEDLNRAVKQAGGIIAEYAAALFRLQSERIISSLQDVKGNIFPSDFLGSRVAPFLEKSLLVPVGIADGELSKGFQFFSQE